jgi:hypothetical protein
MEELLEAVFPIWSSSLLYGKAVWTSLESLQPEYEVGVGWSPVCKDVSPEEEARPPLKPLPSNVTENTGLYVIVICEV